MKLERVASSCLVRVTDDSMHTDTGKLGGRSPLVRSTYVSMETGPVMAQPSRMLACSLYDGLIDSNKLLFYRLSGCIGLVF